jgi:CRP-like cAMP-binding protein
VEKLDTQDKHSELYHYNQGEIILKEGESSSFIHILKRGKLGVYKGDVKVTELKGNGLIFGEMSSILGRPRTSTVKAEQECEVLIYRGGIEGIIRKFPSITQKILVLLAERLENLTEKFSTLQYQNACLQNELDRIKELSKESATKEPCDENQRNIPDDAISDGDILGYPRRRKL